jgi:hypothetical protein
MRYARWAVAALIVVYCLWSLMPLVGTATWKLGLYELPADQLKYQALMESTPWAQLALWAVAVAMWLFAAWRLFRGLPTFTVYVLALVLDMINYAWVRATGEYDRVMSEAISTDYVIIAAMVAAGAFIWWTERGRRGIGGAATA